MKLLFISTFLDSPIHRNRAPYNEQLIERLTDNVDVEVIRPISWLDWISYLFNIKNPPAKRDISNSIVRSSSIPCSYPVLFYLPVVGSAINGFLYFLSIFLFSFKKVRKADTLYASWLYPDGYAVMMLARMFNKPYLVQALGSDVNELLYHSATKKKVLSVVKNANIVSVVSHDLKNKLVEQGVDEKKIAVIYTGIETSKFFPVAKFIAEQKLGLANKKRILYVGNLKRAKGINDLLMAVVALYKKRQDFELCIAGNGPERDAITEYEHQYPDLIHSLGVVDHNKLQEWVNAASCVCLPSYSEGVPNVLLEAMACETNVVATRVGGIPEVVANADEYLVDAGDIPQLAEALDGMLDEKNFVTRPERLITSYQQMADEVKDKLLNL